MHTLANSLCPVCGCEVRDRRVYCAGCEAPHHKECFEYVGQCAIYGCAGQRFEATPRVSEPPPASASAAVQSQSGPPFIVEFISVREGLAGLLLVVSLVATVLAGVDQSGRHELFAANSKAFVVFALLSILAMFLLLGTNDYWLVDPSAGTIWRHYWFFGYKKLVSEVSRDRCTFVRLRAERLGTQSTHENPQVLWALQVGRPQEDELQLRTWGLLIDPDRPDDTPEPTKDMVEFATNVAAVMGRELEIVRRPSYRAIADAEKFHDGNWGRR